MKNIFNYKRKRTEKNKFMQDIKQLMESKLEQDGEKFYILKTYLEKK